MNTTPIAAVKAELSTVTPLADQLRAMQTAVSREAELLRKLHQLEAQQATAERAAVAKANSIARFRDIEVVGTGKESPRMDDYAIHYSERVSDMLTMQPVWKRGRQSLTGPAPDLYTALLADPSVLPAAILALDADPDAAVRRYCRDKTRGYVAG